MSEKELRTAVAMCIAGLWYRHKDYAELTQMKKVLRIFLRISMSEGHDYGHILTESSLAEELTEACLAGALVACYLSAAFCYKHSFSAHKEECLSRLPLDDRVRIETAVEHARTLLGRYGSPEQAIDAFEREAAEMTRVAAAR